MRKQMEKTPSNRDLTVRKGKREQSFTQDPNPIARSFIVESIALLFLTCMSKPYQSSSSDNYSQAYNH